jgi:acyl carrier protein
LSGANLPKSDTRSDDLLLVQNVLAKLLGLKSQEVRPELTLRQLHVDDLDLVEAVMEIEDTLKIQIPDQVLTSAAEPQSTQAALDQLTVKQLAAIVTANRNSR